MDSAQTNRSPLYARSTDTASLPPIPEVGRDAELQAAEAWVNACIARARAVGAFAEAVEVGPAIAQVLLARNPENRRPIPAAVKEYAAQLQSGRWEENGETIKVSAAGLLNDGQNRCLACVQTGIKFRSFVVFGVSRDSRGTVDIGRRRTPGDMLTMVGVTDANTVAAILRALVNLENGADLGTHIPAPDIQKALAKYPDVVHVPQTVRTIAHAFRQPRGALGAVYYHTRLKDPFKAEEFWTQLRDGTGFTSKTHPISMLRRRFESARAQRTRATPSEVAAWAIKSWNAWLAGAQMGTLRWNADGPQAEAFPKILGPRDVAETPTGA